MDVSPAVIALDDKHGAWTTDFLDGLDNWPVTFVNMVFTFLSKITTSTVINCYCMYTGTFENKIIDSKPNNTSKDFIT